MIYFIQDTRSKAIKIGISKEPVKRLSTLQTGHPSELRLIAVMDGDAIDEQALHRLFTKKRGEWFLPTSDLLAFIREQAISIASLRDIKSTYKIGKKDRPMQIDWQENAMLVVEKLRSGECTNKAKAIELVFRCSRSGRPNSTYQQAVTLVDQLTERYPHRTPEQEALRKQLNLN